MATKDNLLQRANQIENETLEGANNEERVGSLFRDIINFISASAGLSESDVTNLLNQRINLLEPNQSIDNLADGIWLQFNGANRFGLLQFGRAAGGQHRRQFRFSEAGIEERHSSVLDLDWGAWSRAFRIVDLGINPNLDHLSGNGYFTYTDARVEMMHNRFFLYVFAQPHGNTKQIRFGFNGIEEREFVQSMIVDVDSYWMPWRSIGTSAGFGNMRLRTLTEDVDYTKSLVLKTETIETEVLNNYRVFIGNIFDERNENTVTFNHSVAIPTTIEDIESILIGTWGAMNTSVNVKAIEPFIAESGFETKRIIGEFTHQDSVFDFHICIGFVYSQNNQVINQNIGYPLFSLMKGVRSSVFVSRRTGSANFTYNIIEISGKNAVNVIPVAEVGRIELKQPLKPNERLNAMASHDISANIEHLGLSISFQPKSNITLAPIGYVDMEVAADPALLLVWSISPAIINVLVTVDEYGATFSSSGFFELWMVNQIMDLKIDFSVHSVEIVEIME